MRISIITFQETFGKKDLSRAGFFSDYRDVGATKKSVKVRGPGLARWTVEARGTGMERRCAPASAAADSIRKDCGQKVADYFFTARGRSVRTRRRRM
jgi:hypothetical protein